MIFYIFVVDYFFGLPSTYLPRVGSGAVEYAHLFPDRMSKEATNQGIAFDVIVVNKAASEITQHCVGWGIGGA